MSEQESWLDANFIQRLQGRTVQPGIIRLDMGREVVSRLVQMAEQHPLLQELGRRWQSSLMAQSEQLPIVYARPAVVEPVNTAVSTQPRQPHQPQTVKPIVIPPKRTPSDNQSGKRPFTQPNQPENRAVPSQQPQTTKSGIDSLPMAKSNAVTARPKLVEKVVSQKQKQQPVSTLADNQPEAKALQGKTARPELVEGAVSSNNPQPSPSIGETDTPLPLATSPNQSATVATATTKPVSTLKAQPRAVVQGKKVTSKKGKASSNAPSASQSTLVLATHAPRVPRKTEPVGKAQPPIIASSQQSQPRTASVMPVVKPQPLTSKRSAAKPALPAVKSTVGKRIIGGSPPSGSKSTTRLPVVRPFHASPKREASQMPLPAQPAPRTAVTPTVASRPTMGAASNVIQRQVDETANGGETAPSTRSGRAVSPEVNINEIVEEVQRQFMRQLAIEGERRGAALC
ncbi:hypothetical protein MNBD_CHLOROFLEXI01-377 [hydrothermal vent metagenome]|uniref:Uncharacterized protein n=1 Tax=hydrothermal vent metagenome TaxID=652676 RepID=A0A3B0VAZ9_9ZZZZ